MRPSHWAVRAATRPRSRPKRFEKQLAGCLFVDAVQGEMAAHPLAGLDRREEADTVEAVIERHFRAVGDQHTSAAIRLKQ